MGGYHPITIMLEACHPSQFDLEQASSLPIFQDTYYPLSINATFLPIWHMPCTQDFGHLVVGVVKFVSEPQFKPELAEPNL